MLRDRAKTGKGQRLGSKYTLVERLGRGAMGEVWRAKEKGAPDRAIKVLRPELSEDPALVGRFLRERTVLTASTTPRWCGCSTSWWRAPPSPSSWS